MRLNRRVPVGTHGGVRGRLSIYESLLLDSVVGGAVYRVSGSTEISMSISKARFHGKR